MLEVNSELFMQIGYLLIGICIGMLIGYYVWNDDE